MIDVGQGDSTLIITPKNKKILVDGGGSETYEVGENVVKPYLLKEKIIKLDYVIISHFDSDHVKGIIEILDDFYIDKIIIPKQFSESENYNTFNEIIKKEKLRVVIVEKGSKIKIEENLFIDILWPDSKNIINENGINNNSIVCKLIYKKFSILFTGDIESIAEKKLVEEYKNSEKLKSTVLKVGHHGSKSSSINEFLDLVKPQYAIIGVGENNKFGHPNPGVIDRLEKIDTKILRTDINGEISLRVRNETTVNIEIWTMLTLSDKIQTKIGRKKNRFQLKCI